MGEQDWDRRFSEVLQELRVMQTGIQILFASMLTLPFTNRFEHIDQLQRGFYVGTLIASAAATAFLIAPVSLHRLMGEGYKPQVVRVAAAMTKAGLVLLLLAVAGAVYLVLDLVVGAAWAGVAAAFLAVLYIGLWYVVPVLDKLHRRPR
ncbi:MAG: amine oxidase [Hamadaea sp.]|nr:amine oxidase [Hamadaea sp.]NUR51419.1 amine oxidase [Hamadaea sp.]NUT07167.1 amine oxidase [Hamadaea sp.]